MKAVELAKIIYERRKKFFDNLDRYLKVIKERTLKMLPDAKIYLFGSVLRKDYHPMLSDIDITIVSKNVPEKAIERARIRLKILEGFEFSPFEIHLLKPEEWEFYKKFIDKYKEI